MVSENYFKELGRFLYGIALSDGDVNQKEVRHLETLVKEEMKDHPEEELDAFIILMKLAFFNAKKEELSVHAITGQFVRFLTQFQHLLKPEEKRIGRSLIVKMAKAFGGVSEVENKEMKVVMPLLQ